MRNLVLAFLLVLASLPALADAAVDLTTHQACLAHRMVGGAYPDAWAKCTEFESAYAATAAATLAASMAARAEVDAARDATAQSRLDQ